MALAQEDTDPMIVNEDEVVVQIAEWKPIAWLRHGFSTRWGGVSDICKTDEGQGAGGDLNMGWSTADAAENVAENRRRLIETVGGSEFSRGSLVTVRQVHSAHSFVVPAFASGFVTDDGRATIEADGLMTNVSGKLLGIQTADCVPVLVVDVERRVVAAFHAGWRGTAGRIVEQGLAQMMREYGSQAEDLVAAVGPSIGVCCYSVGEEVQEAFATHFTYADSLFAVRRKGLSEPTATETYLNLWEANRRQLMSAGIPKQRISVVGECSGCAGLPGRRKYFSHRREHGFTGRMMSVVGVVGPG